MNEKDQAEFNRLLSLSPAQFTWQDCAFLSARRDYLTDDQKRIFASILNRQAELVKEYEQVLADEEAGPADEAPAKKI